MAQQDGYAFSSNPRAAPPGRKYRAPGSGAPGVGAGVDGGGGNTIAAANIMYDARVRRGNTYAGRLVPGGTAGANDTQGTMESASATGTMRRSKMKPPKPSIFDVKPPEREHIEVDLTPFLTEQREEVPEVEVTTQTDVFVRRPDTPEYVPKKTGIDAFTQIDETENLFNFDREVAPILDVIVDKTLEQALLEVEEEAELAQIELRKQDLEEGKRREKAALQRMEAEEQKKFEAKELRRKKEVERVRQERDACAKIAALSAARSLAAVAKHAAIAALQREGKFVDPLKVEVESKFLPWLYDAVEARTEQYVAAAGVADDIVRDACALSAKVHADRRAAEKAAAEAAEKRRLEEEEKKGYLNVFLKGVMGEDGKPMRVGPIPVTKYDTVSLVEQKVVAWLRNKMGPDYEPPAEGFMRLGFDGKYLPRDTRLMDESVPDGATLEILDPADAAGEGKDGDDD